MPVQFLDRNRIPEQSFHDIFQINKNGESLFGLGYARPWFHRETDDRRRSPEHICHIHRPNGGTAPQELEFFRHHVSFHH